MKYQFCIRFDKIDANSAASKAVLDCNIIFSKHGYKDYTITVGDNSNKLSYYLMLAKQLLTFYFAIEKNALIGIQYPLLSINKVFKHFTKIARLKGAHFFCIVHDVESLRTGGDNKELINEEVNRLNDYDQIIVHNDKMAGWLKTAGVTREMISLKFFDYLVDPNEAFIKKGIDESIVYAGNLTKSKFVYGLSAIKNKHFNIYGPNLMAEKLSGSPNVSWNGEFSPNVIPAKLTGSFGLIWDGWRIDVCDEILGNYLRYNNPHKSSLYIAAGLPLIAPADSAIGEMITELNIGFLVNSLTELEHITIGTEAYRQMKKSVLLLREKVIKGEFFSSAINLVENEYARNK